jgi:hypothetical protein
MAIEYAIRVFHASDLAGGKMSEEKYQKQKQTILDGLQKLAEEGWRIVGQSSTSDVSSYASIRDADFVISTSVRLIYTLAREK